MGLQTCGFKDDVKELRSLFTLLDEDGNGSVAMKELVRAQLFSQEDIASLLQPNRAFDSMIFEDFCKLIGPELCKKYRREENGNATNSCKSDVFQKILAFESGGLVAMERASTPLAEEVRPRGLPRLPSSQRELSAYSRSASAGAKSRSSSLDVGRVVTIEASAEATSRPEPAPRFQTLRARRARVVCGGSTDEELKKYEFLKNCTPLFLRFLIDELQCEMFMPGANIINEGDIGDKIYLLRHGEAEVLVGPELKKVAVLKEGAAFGEMALFDPSGKRSATVRATELCDCRTLNRRQFMSFLECFPEDKEFFRRVAKQRMAELQKMPDQRIGRRSNSNCRKARRAPACTAPLVFAN